MSDETGQNSTGPEVASSMQLAAPNSTPSYQENPRLLPRELIEIEKNSATFQLLRDPEALLGLFRRNMADQFPFVVIPASTTATGLETEKPFLLKVILMVASVQDSAFQTVMSKEIVEYLGTHLLVGAEKSLDLLQGLLVFCAWSVFQKLPIRTVNQARMLTFCACE